jgi:hypothetical protein
MMAGGDDIETKCIGSRHESVELQMTVALDAWIRGDALCMICDIRIHNVGVEIFGKVENKMVDVKLLGDPSSVIDITH